MNISTNEFCCGCRACEQICPKQAIALTSDREGFYYPLLDAYKCVDCGLCSDVCPVLNYETSLYSRGKAFAAQAKDNKILNVSSSGGIFSVVAKNVLKKGGVVVGAELTKELIVKHVAIEKVTDLYRLQGSKYAQSDTTEIYQEVKGYLKSGRLVFFTGTPCHVSALKLFLRKDYDNLLTSDVVCHGVPSIKMFHQLIKYIEEDQQSKVIDYRFRDKTLLGWSRVSSCTLQKGNKILPLYYNKYMRAFFQAFLEGHVLRMDCYKCPFTKVERTGDFTMADFWSLKDSNPNFPRQHRGVSMVLVNSDKGRKLFNDISKDILLEDSDLDIIVGGYNYQLKHPTELTPERSRIFEIFMNDRDKFLSNYIRCRVKCDRKKFYISAIKEIIKKTIRYHGQY